MNDSADSTLHLKLSKVNTLDNFDSLDDILLSSDDEIKQVKKAPEFSSNSIGSQMSSPVSRPSSLKRFPATANQTSALKDAIPSLEPSDINSKEIPLISSAASMISIESRASKDSKSPKSDIQNKPIISQGSNPLALVLEAGNRRNRRSKKNNVVNKTLIKAIK